MASRRNSRRRVRAQRPRSTPPVQPAAATEARTFDSLAAFLKASKISQTQFARLAGTTQATISRVARGVLIPRPDIADRIAAEAHIPIESFYRVFHARRLERRRQSQITDGERAVS